MQTCPLAVRSRIAEINRPAWPATGTGKCSVFLISLIVLASQIMAVRGQTPTPTPGCIDNWAATITGNAPTGRYQHTAVWTGNEMIVWGGIDNNNHVLNTGGRYNPAADSWTSITNISAPTSRKGYTAVWTGSEMIIWGGFYNASFNTGARYNPATDSWTATSTTNAPSGREYHTAVWTGSEMIVWGGSACAGGVCYVNTGGRYDPATDTWTAINTINAPTPRFEHTAVWTGSEMIVWGGWDGAAGVYPTNTGGRYNPATDSWTATSVTNAPEGDSRSTVVVWTGSEMLLDFWAGYNPTTDIWTRFNNFTASPVGYAHTGVWTGREMIVWGGFDSNNHDLNSGGRYDPSTNTGTYTTTTDAPSGRDSHTAVWTGSEMIIWGGEGYTGVLYTGGRYCAQPLPTPTPGPVVRGSFQYCSNPSPAPVPSALLNLTGTTSGSTYSDPGGNYQFSALVSGGSYTVTQNKSALAPGSTGINTIDVIATQRHYLGLFLLTGCPLAAADVNGDGVVNTVDVTAIQRFALGRSTGIGNVGKYQFAPLNRTYSAITSDQINQNYDTLVLGDVAWFFVE